FKLARWDKMYMHLYENTVAQGQSDDDIEPVDRSNSDNSVTAERLMEMSRKSPFSFAYNNKVQAFIDFYLNSRKELTEHMLGLSEFYFPEIEAALDRHGLPLELKHLVAVESAFNPTAKSRAGAVGLWQFMYGTGKIYGLEVNSYMDDRMDPSKATDAACRFLKDLYKMYGNWELALAAYNSGPGTVNKAIRYSGGHKNYWKIYSYLPRETRGYVPAFIAVNYLFTHQKELGLKPTPHDLSFTQVVDTVHIHYAWNLKDAAEALNTSYDVLKLLNPTLKTDHIPDYNGPFVLNVPYEAALKYAESHKQIAKNKAKAVEQKAKTTASASNSKPISVKSVGGVHVVRSGENLSLISKLYGCSIYDLKMANGLANSRIYVGQKLNLPGGKNKTSTSEVSDVKSSSRMDDNAQYKYYVVQPGDTLWDIAKKHPEVSVSTIRQLNNISNVRNIKPGQKIAIGVI
ncbi:MAG: transglycosylase SLT domain-containing protein, partial [Luteibaculum sp.]